MTEAELVLTLRVYRGTCPPVKDLVDYAEGSISDDSHPCLSQHLEVCGLCSNDVRLARDNDAAGPGPGGTERKTPAGSKKRLHSHLQRVTFQCWVFGARNLAACAFHPCLQPAIVLAR